ncbi:MAG TPA: hypothetical protein VFZ65_14740, partial [Planctomycetota bacterium]|nr:hypothetical protein [Planctomycetota bacterium]
MTSPASEPAPGWRWTRWLPLATAVALALAVVFLRVCEVEAEGDLYHERAEQLLAGTVVFDAFHPFGYVLLLAAVHVFVSPSLVAGGLVSAAAAGVLVWSTGVVAETLRPGAGGPARLFAASNGVVWVLGTMACSDMTSAALVMWAAALLCRSPGQLGFGRSVAIGSLLGYAVGSRFGSLGVAALVCLWTVLRCPRARSVSGLAVGVLAGLAPQAWLAALVDKTPLQNDNWHNMVLKIVCDDDLSRLQHLYDSGTLPSLSDFLREHGGDLLWRAGLDSVTAVGQVLPSLLMGSLRPVDGLQLWPLLLALAGLWFAAPRRRLAAVLTVLAAAATFSVCIAIAPRGRQLFSAIPFLFAGLAAALAALHARGGVCRAILPALWLATVGVGGAQFH